MFLKINENLFINKIGALGIFFITFYFLLNPTHIYSGGIRSIYLYSASIGITASISIWLTSKKYKQSIWCILLFTLIVMPKILIRPYSFDDWYFIGMSLNNLTLSYLLISINDHTIPLLKLIIYVADYILPTLPITFQTLNSVVHILLIVSIDRLLIFLKIQEKIKLFILFVFTLSPFIILDRIWFGGGFWFSVSTCLFLFSIPLACDFFIKKRLNIKNGLWISMMMLALVGLSSQYKLILVNYLTLIYKLYSQVSSKLKIGIALLFTSIIFIFVLFFYEWLFSKAHSIVKINTLWFWEKIYERLIDTLIYTGQWVQALLISFVKYRANEIYINGELIESLAVVNSSKIVSLAISIILMALIVFYFLKIKDKGSETTLVAKFCIFNIFFFFLIVSLARSPASILTPYYQIFPFCLILVTIACIANETHLTYFSDNFIKTIGVIFISVSASHYFINQNDLDKINRQVIFIDELSLAVCDLSRKNQNNDIKILFDVRPSDCPNCKTIMQAPLNYEPRFFPNIAKQVSRIHCPDNYEFINSAGSKGYFDHYNYSSTAMENFLKKYFSEIK